MSRWLRLYDDTINDPKVLKLPEALRWHWIALLCVASKNGGALPALDDIAIQLRLTAAKTTEILMKLVKAGLIDKTETGFAPHNWGGRQYKSDVTDPTAPERMRRYRSNKKSVTQNDRNATVTGKRPETEAETDTDSVANATGATAPSDPSVAERELFDRGKQILGKSAGGQITKLKAAKGGNVALARSVIEAASTKQNPAEYVAAAIRAGPSFAKPLTAHQHKQQEMKEVLDDLANFATGGGSGSKPNLELLRYDPGGRPEGIRGGAGGNTDDFPPRRH